MNLEEKIKYIKDLKNPLLDFVGFKFIEITMEQLIAEIEVDTHLHQPFGILHGGISVLIAESLASLGAFLNIPETHNAVGIEINANHIRQVKKDKVTAKSIPIHIGSKTQVWETIIVNSENKLVCVSRCTVAVIEKNH